MKLERKPTKKVKGKVYYSYIITIPRKLVEELKWEIGTELKARVKRRKLIIEPKQIT